MIKRGDLVKCTGENRSSIGMTTGVEYPVLGLDYYSKGYVDVQSDNGQKVSIPVEMLSPATETPEG